jgi:hypothetical protein
MIPTVTLSFRYLEQDYVRALRTHYAAHLHPRLDILLAIALAGGGIFLWNSERHWFAVTLVILSAILILMIVAAFTIVPLIVFRRQPKLHDEYSLDFSRDGIHFRTNNVESQLKRSLYSRALIDTHSYIIYYGKNQFTVIPKRVFQSGDQQHAFEQLLKDHISEIATR